MQPLAPNTELNRALKKPPIFSAFHAPQFLRGIRKTHSPKAETVAAIADALGVSADYLLGRTDNPIDHVNSAPVVEDAPRDYIGAVPDFVTKFRMLDDVDKAKAEAYLDGLLSADKYRTEIQAKNA